MDNLVTTIKGELLPRCEVRYIDKKYYKIGNVNIKNSGDCYKVENRYRRVETGLIEYDHEINKYILKSSVELIEGVVEVKDDVLIIGFFSPTYKNLNLYCNEKSYIVINEDILKNNRFYRESISDGNYYKYNYIPSKNFTTIKEVSSDLKYNLPYSCTNIFKDQLDLYNLIDTDISQKAKNYHSNIGDFTFGLEFETTRGFIPSRINDKLGVMPLRDGSVQGLEYVTVPYQGSKGCQSLIDFLQELKKRTDYDMTCSFHQHIGGIPRTKEFILALYIQLVYLQDEYYRMFPLYKKYNFRTKNKNYTSPLPTLGIIDRLDKIITKDNINSNFELLFQYLSCGISFSKYDNDLNNVKSHPSDPNDSSKWNIQSRYCLFNFIPLIFGNKETIEFRIHTPTYDENKVFNFLILNTSILKYVINYQNDILQGNYIIKSIRDLPNLSSKVHQYFRKRRDKTNTLTREEGINYDEREIPS